MMMDGIENNKRPKNIGLLQWHTLLLGMVFVLPVLIPYYKDIIGLGFTEFMIGEAAFAAVVIVMEVPTGWISDVWTRKKTMIAATCFNILGWVVLWQAHSFLTATMAQMILGIGMSLLSGTNSALLYDSLLVAGQESRYRKLQGLQHGLGLYAVGGASFLGGFLYEWHPEIPVILSLLTSVAALGICFMMTEPDRHKQTMHKNPLADIIVTIRYALRGHKEIFGIMLLSASLFAVTKVFLWAQQPYYILLDFPVNWYGILMAFGFFMGGVSGHFGHVLDGRHGNIAILMVLLLWACCASFIAGLFPGYHGVALLLTGALIWGFGWPRVQDALNKHIGSERRATVLSTVSLSIQLVSIPLMVITGYITDDIGIAHALIFIAAFLFVSMLLSSLLLWWRLKRYSCLP